jgi:hypothetical protein
LTKQCTCINSPFTNSMHLYLSYSFTMVLSFVSSLSMMILCMSNIWRIVHNFVSLFLIPSPRSTRHILCSLNAWSNFFYAWVTFLRNP